MPSPASRAERTSACSSCSSPGVVNADASAGCCGAARPRSRASDRASRCATSPRTEPCDRLRVCRPVRSSTAVTGASNQDELREDLELIVRRVGPEFVIATGDLADYGQREELEAYREAVTGLGVPVASVPGNHDHLSCLTRQAIEEFFGGWAT